MFDKNRFIKNLLGYFLLYELEAGVLVWYLLSTPADPKNVVALGYSLPRLITMAGFILVFLVCLYAAYKIYKNTTPVVLFFEKLFSRQSLLWLIFFLANFLILFGLIYILTSPSSPRELKIFYNTFHLKPIAVFLIYIAPAYKVALPVVTWVSLVSAQTGLALLYIFVRQFKEAIRSDFNRPRSRILVFMVGVAALSILLVGLSVTLPYLIVPNRTQALHFARNINMKNLHRYTWVLAIYLNLALAWLWSKIFSSITIKKASSTGSFWYLLPFIAALTVSFYWLTVNVAGEVGNNHAPSNWDVFYVSPDSGGYIEQYSTQSLRPPIYPLFIQLVTAGSGFDHDPRNYLVNQSIEDINDPLIRVTRTQKVVLLTTSLVACAALMGLMNSPLPALLFLGLYEFGFFSQEINNILSEPIAQAWLFLMLATFFAFLWKQWKFLLLLGGAFYAALYLTRPAGIYGGVLLAAMLLWAMKAGWRKYWLSCLAAVLLPAGLVAIPIFYTYLAIGSLSPAPMYGYAQIAFALQVADSDDLNLMPDEEAREFLTKALEVKRIEDFKIKATVLDANERLLNMLSSNIYQVAIPVANEIPPNTSDRSSLLIRVSTPLLKQHRAEYFMIGWNSFWYAATQMSMDRVIKGPYSLGIVILISLILALYLRGWVGFCSISLILTHLAHMVIVSLFDFPLTRYLWATELLVLIAGFILVWGIFNRLSEH